MMDTSLPSLSIVVEWENAKSSELDRARSMLVALADQTRRLSNRFPAAPELILVHDAEDSAAEDTLAVVRGAIGDFIGEIRVLPCEGLDYYAQKNFGAGAAHNQVVLLADSDIIPEPDWLERLLTCLVEEKADVVCGATHLDTGAFYEKAFAGFWFFPMRSETPPRQRSEHFFANNVAFRREVLAAFPFPDLPLVRGSCRVLAGTLLDNGKVIMIEPAARVGHPPPNGLAHFVKRALCSGQDNVHLQEEPGVLGAARRLKWQMVGARRRIMSHRRELGLGALGAVGALLVAAGYFGLEFIGDLVTRVNPTLIRTNLRV